MPKNKDFKRLVRRRMEKTGESYTTARAHLLRRRDAERPASASESGPSDAPTPSAAELAELAGTSDDSVRESTGRDWAGWVRALDAIGAADLPHREIAAWLREHHGLSGWWSQTVTVGYERIRGLRAVGQRRDGSFEAGKSKTIHAPLSDLYEAFAADDRRSGWLPSVDWTVRGASPGKSMRITWPDGTSVAIRFTEKGPERSQVSVQHEGLASQEERAAKKEYWGKRLAALAELLSSRG